MRQYQGGVYRLALTAEEIEARLHAASVPQRGAVCPSCGAPRSGTYRCQYCGTVDADLARFDFDRGLLTRQEFRELLGLDAEPEQCSSGHGADPPVLLGQGGNGGGGGCTFVYADNRPFDRAIPDES